MPLLAIGTAVASTISSLAQQKQAKENKERALDKMGENTDKILANLGQEKSSIVSQQIASSNMSKSMVDTASTPQEAQMLRQADIQERSQTNTALQQLGQMQAQIQMESPATMGDQSAAMFGTAIGGVAQGISSYQQAQTTEALIAGLGKGATTGLGKTGSQGTTISQDTKDLIGKLSYNFSKF